MFFPSLAPKGEHMNYAERLEKLDAHISENPKDYQAVIARFKLRSDAIAHKLKHDRDMRLKKVAEIRRKYEQEYYG